MLFKSFRIVVFAINMTDGESEVTYRVEDEQDAIIKYHDMCSSYGGNKTAVKNAVVTMFDQDGGLIRREVFKHPVPEPKVVTEA